MDSNKKTAGIMLDVRIILAVLWVAEVLSSLNGDTYRLSDPGLNKKHESMQYSMFLLIM